MKRITRLSPRILVTLAALAALVAGGLFAVTARNSFASPKPGASRTSGVSSFAAKGGVLKIKGTVVVAKLGKLSSQPAASTTKTPRVVTMRGRPASSSHAATTTAHVPGATSNGASKGTVLSNFDGVNAIQNSVATGGQDLEPPDEGMGAGGGYVGNFVNVTGAFYTTGGATAAGPFALYNFFLEPSTVNLSDPRIFYDSPTHTWFANLFEYNFAGESHEDLAVNTGNPVTGTWTIYTIDSTDAATPNCPCFPDYTINGVDSNNYYLSGNEFSLVNSAFNGAEIWAISKSELEAGTAASYAYFNQLSIGGAPAYHVQPAITYGNPSAEYFMNSLDPNNTFDNRLGVWALTNGASITTGSGVPSLTSTIISSEAYAMPLNAPTPPGFNQFENSATTGVVTADFDAMQEVQYVNGHLDGALNTSVNISGDTGARDGIAWFQVDPKISSGAISPSTKVAHQGYVSLSGEYLMYPHINEVKDGGMAIVATMGGPNTYLSAVYVTKSGGAKNFGAVQIAAGGTGPDNGFTMTPAFGGVGRWGDYSNGEVDYSQNTVFLATQYIPNAGDGIANWGNRIFEVQL